MTAPDTTTEDIDALLADAIDLAHAILGIDDIAVDDPESASLAARVLALHEHLTNGGRLPAAWATQ
ncbi:Uncharacterised protein [Mycobacteroides abscessus subsp. abscessus]|nr:Uncharacterised protein [Mycobacteroides abscessus subsp. abscessus]